MAEMDFKKGGKKYPNRKIQLTEGGLGKPIFMGWWPRATRISQGRNLKRGKTLIAVTGKGLEKPLNGRGDPQPLGAGEHPAKGLSNGPH